MLNNTVYKLKNEKKLRIAYFGGSITEGAGSSDPTSTCYRALTTEYFRNKYPDADIAEIYAAIGGTGTSFGMFRLRKDVLAYEPDLIFVEYAVNDFGDTEANVLAQTESILRQIRQEMPNTDVLILVSTAEMVIEALANGEAFESRDAQIKAAERYSVPVIPFGEALEKAIRDSGRPLTDFIPDTLHPGDMGYRIMADYLFEALDGMLEAAPAELIPHTVPEKLSDMASSRGDILYPSELCDLKLDGFTVDKKPVGKFEECLRATVPGSSFTFTFEGIGIGIYRADDDGNRDLLFTIDGGEPIRKDSWNMYVRSFHRLGAAVVTKALPYGKHTVTVTVPENGGDVSIGGMFVC